MTFNGKYTQTECNIPQIIRDQCKRKVLGASAVRLVFSLHRLITVLPLDRHEDSRHLKIRTRQLISKCRS